MSNLRKDLSRTFVTHSINLVLSLGNSIAVTRLLGVEGKGEMTIFLSSVGLWQLVLGLGFDQSIRYYVASQKIGIREIIVPTLVYAFIIGLAFQFSIHLFHSVSDFSLFLSESTQSLRFELILSGSITISLIQSNFVSILYALQRFNKTNTVLLIFGILSSLTHLLLLLAQEFDLCSISVFNIFSIHFGLLFFNFILTLYFISFEISFKNLSLRNLLNQIVSLKIMIGYGAITYLAGLSQFLNYRIDFWIVQNLLSTSALGIYALAVNLSQLIWVLPKSLASVLLPNTAANNKEDWNSVLMTGRITFAFCLVFGILAASIAFWIIPLFYGKSFADSVTPFIILLVGTIPFALSIVYASVLGGKNMIRSNLIASLAGLGVTVLFNFILIPLLGILGSAIASSLSYIVTTSILLSNVSKVSNNSIKNLIVIKRSDFSSLMKIF